MEERETQVVEFGPIRAHAVSADEAVDLIARRAASGRGGFVLTPNLDHLALSRRNPEFGAAYARAFLSLVDGMPLVATSRLLRLPIREKVSGSDLFEPLMAVRCRGRPPGCPGSVSSGSIASRRSRLWRRYLIEDPQTLPVFLRMALDRAGGRPLHHACRLVTSPLAESGETP